MTVLKELVVPAGKFIGRDNKPRTRWKTIGHLHRTADGKREYLTLDPVFNLAAFPRDREGDDRLYVELFDPKPAGNTPPPPRQDPTPPPPASDGFEDDDLPF
jgi:hypothetical protein